MPPPSVLRPELREPLRHFVIACFALLAGDVGAGEEVPFAIEERRGAGGPALYDYHPLFRRYVDARAERVRALADYRRAVDAVRMDPAACAYARSRANPAVSEEEAIRSGILWPLLVSVAERLGGFDFDDLAFESVYGAVETRVVSETLRYEALVPLIGVLVSQPPADLGGGVSLRRATAAEIAQLWPEADGLLPERFGLEPDRLCALSLSLELDRGPGAAAPDAVRLATAAVTALRLVSGGAIAAGPLLFERIDQTQQAVRPLPPEVARQPLGEARRLDVLTLGVARSLCERLYAAGAPADRLGTALSRWSASLGLPGDAERAAASAAALAPLLGTDAQWDGATALRAAALAGRTAAERVRVAAAFRDVARGATGAPPSPGEAVRVGADVDAAVRAVLVAALLDDRRGADLAQALDEVLLGARPRPQLVPNGIATLAA